VAVRARHELHERVLGETHPVGVGEAAERVQRELADVAGQEVDHHAHGRLRAVDRLVILGEIARDAQRVGGLSRRAFNRLELPARDSERHGGLLS